MNTYTDKCVFEMKMIYIYTYVDFEKDTFLLSWPSPW